MDNQSTITDRQIRGLVEYLEKDRQSHMMAHGSWHLDYGKMVAALASVGFQWRPEATTAERVTRALHDRIIEPA